MAARCDDLPWNPTARLFRQHHPGDWSGVIAAVARLLGSVDRALGCRCSALNGGS
jgi:hypothetical protein